LQESREEQQLIRKEGNPLGSPNRNLREVVRNSNHSNSKINTKKMTTYTITIDSKG